MDLTAMNENKFLKPKKILVIEDDRSMTVFLGRALLEMNSDFEIHWASSLEQSIKQLIQNTDITQKSPFDLVIADIFLEGNGTGLDFFKLMEDTYPNIPFLVVSSLPDEQVIESIGEHRSQNLIYLRKPFLFSECKEKIKQIINDY